jgi:predicted N-acyltransferase
VPTLHNLLEPANLVRHFQDHPPEGFSTLNPVDGAPAFSAPFDLLTTVEPALRRTIDRWPFARRWRRFLHANTCFIGTTVSEYALLSDAAAPERQVRDLLVAVAPRYPFLIIKDLPMEATLVGDAAFAFSRRLADLCREAGFVLVGGQALAYVPIDFASTDEFLATLSHTRRKNLRRKLRSASQLTVEEIPTGDTYFSNEARLSELYELYMNVYRQSEIHFDLLTPAFFRAVLQDRSTAGLVFTYRVDGALIAFNFCVRQGAMLIDKYVGFAYPQSRHYNLYAVSWFHNLEYALAHGLRYYVAGWTDPEIKRELGARFTFTEHAVYVRSLVLRTLLKPFKRLFETDHKWQDASVSITHS